MSTKDKAFDVFLWIIYNSFDDPGAGSALYLFDQLTSIVNEKYSNNLAGLISAAGSKWSSYALDDFYLSTSPTNNGFVTCDGNQDE